MKLFVWSIWLCTLSVTLYSAKKIRAQTKFIKKPTLQGDYQYSMNCFREEYSFFRLYKSQVQNFASPSYDNPSEVVLNTMVTTNIALIILQLKSSPCIDLNMHRWCSLNDTPGASFKPERVREISNKNSHKNCTHL